MANITNKELAAIVNNLATTVGNLTTVVSNQETHLASLDAKLEALIETKDSKPARPAGKSKSKSNNNKTTAPRASWSEDKAANGNGKVIWLKFDKSPSNEVYCYLKDLFYNPKNMKDPRNFTPLEGKKNRWNRSNKHKAYYTFSTKEELERVKWIEEHYVPGTAEELAIRDAYFKANRRAK